MHPPDRPHVVEDPDDPLLDDYRHLTDAAARRTSHSDAPDGIVIVEGALALEQLVDSRLEIRSVLCSPARAERHSELLERVPGPVFLADRAVLEGVTGFDVHRGLLASARRPSPVDPAMLLAPARRLVLAVGVNDNENIGSLVRAAVALGVDGVLLDATSADPLYRRSVRVSLGWSLRLPHARVTTALDGLESAHRAGFASVALTPRNEATRSDQAAAAGALDDPVLLVVGAEGPGLSDQVLAAASHRVRIPMAPGVDSLNVATAFAVVAAFAGARRGWA